MILFLSNGHGEDLIGAALAARVRAARPELEVKALAVVGEGKPYARAGIPLVGPRRTMPSGGFTRNSLANLAADLRAGLLGLLWGQAAEVRRLAPETDLCVAVGDILVLWFALRRGRRPTVFLPTAKSEHIAGHFAPEVALMRGCVKVFPRDALTAQALAAQGVPAEYVGNAMMDCLDVTGEPLRPALEPAERVVGFLPGSRQEAYLNLADLTAVAARLQSLVPDPVAFPVAVAPSLDLVRAAAAIRGAGGEARLVGEPAPPTSGPLLTLVPGRLGDVVLASEVLVGLAGTANEQAVGLGRPVVTCPGRGAQFTPAFAAAQKRLLGEAVDQVEAEPGRVAAAVARLLADEAERRRRGEVGRERMGGPGGTDRMAAGILAAWEEGRRRDRT